MHRLGAIQKRESLFRFQLLWLDSRLFESVSTSQPIACVKAFTFSNQRQGQVGQRREIATGAYRSLFRHQWMNAAIEGGVTSAPASYVLTWSRFDNAAGTSAGPTEETRVSSPRADAPSSILQGADFITVSIRTVHPDYPGWNAPANVYLRRVPAGWEAVGLDRELADTRHSTD